MPSKVQSLRFAPFGCEASGQVAESKGSSSDSGRQQVQTVTEERGAVTELHSPAGECSEVLFFSPTDLACC